MQRTTEATIQTTNRLLVTDGVHIKRQIITPAQEARIDQYTDGVRARVHPTHPFVCLEVAPKGSGLPLDEVMARPLNLTPDEAEHLAQLLISLAQQAREMKP